jgi:hypothetical protein
MRAFAFHQKFSLNRERLARMLQCIADGEATSEDAVAAYMGVNPYMVQGFRGWLCKTGLGSATKQQYDLSEIGSLVAAHDPALSQPGTLWLLHYYLASDHNERAEVWYRLFNEFATPGTSFTRTELQTYVERVVDELPTNKTAVTNDANEALKCYTRSDALGDLHLLCTSGKDQYAVDTIQEPDPHIVAFVLFDSWSRRYPGIDTLRLTQVCQEPEMPGRIFLARRDQVLRWLSTLQAMGLVTVADTQQEPVARRFQDSPLTLLERYYHQL